MKNVLITGTSKGIGRAIATELKYSGYNVFGSGRTQLDDNNYLSVDLCDINNARILFDKAKETLGSVDILINNAGGYIYSPVQKMLPEDIKRLIKLNFEVPYLLCSYAVSDMKQNNKGRIVNIGSISGAVGEAGASLYSATKSALSGLTKSLALELAQNNITVNQINPGWVDTNLTKEALSESERQETLDVIPQRRFVEPWEVAKLTKYLISDEAKGLTGQCINLCAGLSVGC